MGVEQLPESIPKASSIITHVLTHSCLQRAAASCFAVTVSCLSVYGYPKASARRAVFEPSLQQPSALSLFSQSKNVERLFQSSGVFKIPNALGGGCISFKYNTRKKQLKN